MKKNNSIDYFKVMENLNWIDKSKIGFPPIIDSHSKILLLGTMPGEQSLEKTEYYGNPNNSFWKILMLLFNYPTPNNYSEKIEFLYQKHIAVWDVLKSCQREGSLDTAIKEPLANDFKSLYISYPEIRHIFFTSKNAGMYYKKFIGFDDQHSFNVLQSPSPANAKISFERKLESWKILLNFIQ